MNQSIKVRILKNVREKISLESSTYICFALDEIEKHDHRRNVQGIIQELRDNVKQAIAPHRSWGDYLLANGKAASIRAVKAARLAWLDQAIACLEQPATAGNCR